MLARRALVLSALLVACDGGAPTTDASVRDAGPDAQGVDAASDDGGAMDAGARDSGAGDAGDAGPEDGGAMDGGAPDASAEDASAEDASAEDASAEDASADDAGPSPDDPDGDSFTTPVELACGTDPDDGADAPDPTTLRGAGTAADPYRLCLAAHLVLLAALPDAIEAHAVLDGDLDFTGLAGPLLPIGTLAAPYAGTFDGAGHVIRGLVVGTALEPRQGLFGWIGAEGVVRDVHLTGAITYGGSPLAAESAGTIERVTVEGTIRGGDHVGIVVNINHAGGVVRDASSAGTISAPLSHVGGIAGQSDGLIERCSSSASVRGQHRTGGLVGSGAGTIRESFATGTVTGMGRWTGGLIGSARDGATITDCYAVGAVSAAMGAAGGLVGNAEAATITRVYASNTVGSSAPSGVLGEDTAGTVVLSSCYFDASLTPADARCAALTPAQMSLAASFTGFDFTTPVWRMDPALRSSPVLDWQ